MKKSKTPLVNKPFCISILFLVLMFFIKPSFSYSQNYSNLRTERRHAISANIGYGLGISYDVFLNSHINLETSASILPWGFHGGIYYYPFKFNKSKRWTTYIGAKYGDTQFGIFNIYRYRSLYVPIGGHYISSRGLNFSADIGLLSITEDEPFFRSGADRTVVPLINFKIGYRFGTLKNPKMIRKSSSKKETFTKREHNIRSQRKKGIYLIGNSPFTNKHNYGGIGLHYFLTEQLNFELSVPLKFNGIGGGIQFHPWGKRKNMLWSPYIGLSYLWVKDDWNNTEGDSMAFSIPIGFIFTNNSGISLGWFAAYGVSDYIGYDYSHSSYETTKLEKHSELAFIGLILGYRF